MRANLLTYTIIMLRRWGASHRSALPKLSQPGDYRSPGRGTKQLAPDIYIDPELQKVETAVCKADPKDREILQAHYLRGGTVTAKHKRMGIARRTYYCRLESAQWYVKQALD